MKNPYINLENDPKSPHDKRIYQLVWALGTLQERLLRLVKEPVWRSFNGQVYTPSTLSDRHLHNLIQLCLRCQRDYGNALPPNFQAFVDEQQRRGDLGRLEELKRRGVQVTLEEVQDARRQSKRDVR